MDNEIVYLTLEQILVIHEDQIDRYGGSHGIRELHLLESAIFRPQTTFSGEDLYPTVYRKAAALLHSLVLNHPFIDGNKRTATVCAIIFLNLNGFSLNVSTKELVAIILSIATKDKTVEDLAEWIEQVATKK